MLKILLALLLTVDTLVLLLLVTGIVYTILWGRINILLPGLGLIITSDLILILLFVVEMFLAAISLLLFRYIKNSSDALA